jgi:hypothetical protein
MSDQSIEARRKSAGPGLISRAFGVCATLLLPVGGMIGVLALSYAGRDRYVTTFDMFPPEQWYLNPGYWLNYGHLVLPGIFLVLCLTNRRYGPGVTMSAVLVSWVIVAGLFIWATATYGLQAVQGELATLPVMATFAGALFAGQILCVYLFDRLRGIPWWRAPFYAILWGGVLYAGLFYVQLLMQSDAPVANRTAVILAIHVGWAFLGLFVYQLFRRLIRPLPGYGGA